MNNKSSLETYFRHYFEMSYPPFSRKSIRLDFDPGRSLKYFFLNSSGVQSETIPSYRNTNFIGTGNTLSDIIALRLNGINNDSTTKKIILEMLIEIQKLYNQKIREAQRNWFVDIQSIHTTLSYEWGGLISSLESLNSIPDSVIANMQNWSTDYKSLMVSITSSIEKLTEKYQINLGSLFPNLQNRNRRNVYRLSSSPNWARLLMTIMTLRFPIANGSESRNWTSSGGNVNFSILRKIDNNSIPEFMGRPIEVLNGNLRSIFTYIPEIKRVVGIWRSNVTVFNEDMTDRQLFGLRGNKKIEINYNTELVRNLIVKVSFPEDASLDFNRLFDSRNNLYTKVRSLDPFNHGEMNREIVLYVSLTIYSVNLQRYFYVPWVIETLDGQNDYENFYRMWRSWLESQYGDDFLNGETFEIGNLMWIFHFSFIREHNAAYYNLTNRATVATKESTTFRYSTNSFGKRVKQIERGRSRNAKTQQRSQSVPIRRNNTTSFRSRSLRPVIQTSHLLKSSLKKFDQTPVGAPYAGTLREKHFLEGSMINRFVSDRALFQTPFRSKYNCLLMSLMRCQVYKYQFENQKCTNFQCSALQYFHANQSSSQYTCDGVFVESVQIWTKMFPFLKIENGKYFIHLFNPIKYEDGRNYLPGARDDEEIEAWEKAAEEIWIHLERSINQSIDYTNLNETCQIFSNFFNVCIMIYDVEYRGKRVHCYTPNSLSLQEIITEKNEMMIIHLLFDQGHMHAISNYSDFAKSKNRARFHIYNYCPICCEHSTRELNQSRNSTMNHITECLKKNKSFLTEFRQKEEEFLETSNKVVKKHYFKKGKNLAFRYTCEKCYQSITQENYLAHVCIVPTKKSDQIPNEKLFVYDLECAQVIDEYGLLKHECNCLYVYPMYPLPGENGIYYANEIDFINAITSEEKYYDSVFLAHNGGAYDVHFLLRILERQEIEHKYVPAPTSKHKFIGIMLTETNIRFLDFMRFIPGSLKSIAEAFGISLHKGDFPHKFNNGNHDNYIGPFPTKDDENNWWSLDQFRNEKSKKDFEDWYSKQIDLYCFCNGTCECDKPKWCFQTELKKYCELDVKILAEVARLYRESCLHFEKIDEDENYKDTVLNWNPVPIDPYQFMTLPQLTIQTFIQGFGESDNHQYDFSGIPSISLRLRPSWCSDSLLWMQRMSDLNNEYIINRGNYYKEYYDFETELFLDGYAPESHSVYLYLNCTYWSCPLCCLEDHERGLKNTIRGIWAQDVYRDIQKKINDLRRLYAKVYVIWDHEYNSSFYDPYLLESSRLMKAEDCFYGGRTEVFALYANSEKLEKTINYHDVTSLYPSVYAHFELPFGVPRHVIGRNIDLTRFHPTHSNRYFGYAKIKIEPNKTDIIGLLPQRDPKTGRLVFPVIPMIGCWGTEEIYLAMQNGYVVKEVYELYYWEERQRSDQHLRGYVGYFLRMKQEAEGWKKLGASCDEPTEDEQNEIADQLYRQNGNLGKIRPAKVKKNPIFRSLAKLFLNSLWGKFAQRPTKNLNRTIYGAQEFYELWNSKKIVQSSCLFREISPGVFKVNYKPKDEFIDPVRHGNLFLAAKVTETARCQLHRQMLKVGPERILYCDTDSIIFLTGQGDPDYTGIGLGKWTDEYPDDKIVEFYALAPKLYALKLVKKNQLVESYRAKGVQLTLENRNQITFEKVLPMIEKSLKGEGEHVIPVKNFSIFPNSTNNRLPFGNVFTRYNEKKVRTIITKRVLKTDPNANLASMSIIRTYPYGYDI
jgi:hypothetical protein